MHKTRKPLIYKEKPPKPCGFSGSLFGTAEGIRTHNKNRYNRCAPRLSKNPWEINLDSCAFCPQ